MRVRAYACVIDPSVARAIRMASFCVSSRIDVDLTYVVSEASLFTVTSFSSGSRERRAILHACSDREHLAVISKIFNVKNICLWKFYLRVSNIHWFHAEYRLHRESRYANLLSIYKLIRFSTERKCEIGYHNRCIEKFRIIMIRD